MECSTLLTELNEALVALAGFVVGLVIGHFAFRKENSK